MSYELDIEIEGLPPLLTNSRMHHMERHRIVRSWKDTVWVRTIGKRPARPLAKAELTLTRYSTSEPDADNLASGFKAILDGLVDVGVIEDDKPSVIGSPTYRWEKAKRKEGRIRIQVTGTEGDSDGRAATDHRGA